MTTKNEFVLAADIGGTHITAALIDIQRRKIILPSLVREPVDANGNTGTIIAAWSRCMMKAQSGAEVSKICLAMPGPFDYVRGISGMRGQGKYDALYQLNVKELLAEAMQVNPEQFFMENDAACFLQGEVFAGCAADGFQKIIGVTLGTGLGSAVYANGASRSADLWSMPFRGSIAEDYLCTRWFIQRYTAWTGIPVSGVKELAEQADTNTVAQSLFREFGRTLAEFLGSFIRQEQPQAVVIGGNIANAYELFRRDLEDILIYNYPLVKTRKSRLGEQAALFGAAGSWHSAEERNLTLAR